MSISAGQPILGDNGDGTYHTPFRITVFYSAGSIFQTAVAVLSDRAQLACIDSEHYPPTPEHPTPEVLTFGNLLSRKDIDELLERGTELVHILVYNDAQSNLYKDGDVIYDQRVVCFTIEDLYMHMLPVNNLAAVFLLEHLACYTFPAYKSTNEDVSKDTGRCLATAINFEVSTRGKQQKGVGLTILELCSGIDGFDKISNVITKGKIIHDLYERSANTQLDEGLFVKISAGTCWAVNVDNLKSSSYIDAIVGLAQAHPGVVKSAPDFLMLYAVECHVKNKVVYPGWQVVLIRLGSGMRPDDVLRPIATSILAADETICTAWLTTLNAASLLTFLYPQKTIVS